MLGEIVNDMKQISAIYDINEAKSNAYYEAAINEYIINRKTAQLKVFQESGTEDDLLYLEAEAEKSFFDKIVDTLQGILNNILTFFKNLYTKVTNIFKKNSDKVDELEKIAKSNPKIGNAKVEVPDTKALEKAYAESMKELDKLEAKVKSGQEITDDDLDKVEKSFFEKHKKALTIGATATTVVGAIAAYKTLATSDTLKGDNIFVKGLNGLISWCNSNREKNLDKTVLKTSSDKKLPGFMYLPKIAMLKASITRATTQGNVVQLKQLLNILKSYVGKGISNNDFEDINLISQTRVSDTIKDPKSKHSDNAFTSNIRYNDSINKSDSRTIIDANIKNLIAGESYNDFLHFENSDESLSSDIAGDFTDDQNNIDDDSISDVMNYNNESGSNDFNESYSDKFSDIINKINTNGLTDRNKFTELQNKIYNNLNTSDLTDDSGDI